ncbi:hypothetical protein LTR37_000259 [Vermiconidia calcicola]|uniref:Uncharacterized protein n=1 Tax=Vermiconidia calcicola TaxID=1690605 RepID=A0ACC3NZZ5_9PEZI|nr:hypothetical protein LTR37_000259 [Vermiconidia calcicola]
MASPTVGRPNTPNASSTKDATKTGSDTSSRRVLGDVSTNIKVISQSPAFLRKAQAGSPLKRSFTSAMESGEGLTYLKRRKLSDDEVLSQANGSFNSSRGNENGQSAFSGSFGPILQPAVENQSTNSVIPEIAEPSPTEPNTPTDEDSSTQDSSAERKSFSSLINYDPSSQTTNFVFKRVSNAEMLKLRLRVAMYKIRTDQIDVPFAEIEHCVPSSSKPRSTTVEEAVAQLRREAQEVNARPKSIPKLMPAPVLRPTAYSSRMIYENERLPSSPPVSRPSGRLPTSPDSNATPRREVPQLSSPPSTGGERFARPDEQDLTSSVVKGRVAEGLLGLRHAG